MTVEDLRFGGLLAQLATMIRTSQWGTRWEVVACVWGHQFRSDDGWAKVSYRDVAAEICRSEGWVYLTMRDLAETEWVLERLRLGPGRRPNHWRVRPDPTLWRGVPWKDTNRGLRVLKIEALCRDLDRGIEGWEMPRSYTAAFSRSAGANAQVAERPRPLNAAVKGPRHSGGLNAAVTPSISVPSEHSLERERDVAGDQLAAAVHAQTGAPVWGRLLRVCDSLAAAHPLPELLAGVAAAPSGYGPPMLIEAWLPRYMAGERPAPVPAARAPGSVTPLEAERKRLETLRGRVRYEEDRYGDVAEDTRRELERCQARVQRLEEAG